MHRLTATATSTVTGLFLSMTHLSNSTWCTVIRTTNFYSKKYYRMHGNNWETSTRFKGPWHAVSIRKLPNGLRHTSHAKSSGSDSGTAKDKRVSKGKKDPGDKDEHASNTKNEGKSGSKDKKDEQDKGKGHSEDKKDNNGKKDEQDKGKGNSEDKKDNNGKKDEQDKGKGDDKEEKK